MSTRERILADVLKNQPSASPLPDMSAFTGKNQNVVQTYSEVFTGIGGKAFRVNDFAGIKTLIAENFDTTKRIITSLPELSDMFERLSTDIDPHTFDDVEVAVIEAELAVAENGAVWLPEQRMGQRIVPYICQHLVVVIPAERIVPTLHEAYAKIGEGDYGFAAFIGGPSKTADIEQALVLGAHGPISMTVFVLEQDTILNTD